MLVMYFLSRVCLKLSQLSQLSFMQYMGCACLALPISLVMIVRICILMISSNRIYETLGYETMTFAICLTIRHVAILSGVTDSISTWHWYRHISWQTDAVIVTNVTENVLLSLHSTVTWYMFCYVNIAPLLRLSYGEGPNGMTGNTT